MIKIIKEHYLKAKEMYKHEEGALSKILDSAIEGNDKSAYTRDFILGLSLVNTNPDESVQFWPTVLALKEPAKHAGVGQTMMLGNVIHGFLKENTLEDITELFNEVNNNEYNDTDNCDLWGRSAQPADGGAAGEDNSDSVEDAVSDAADTAGKDVEE